MPPDLQAVLDKHAKELAKQKENTTKLSKLCLGTLNELEKFEKKQERETSAQPRTEDRIKRIGDENKKLIHLVYPSLSSSVLISLWTLDWETEY